MSKILHHTGKARPRNQKPFPVFQDDETVFQALDFFSGHQVARIDPQEIIRGQVVLGLFHGDAFAEIAGGSVVNDGVAAGFAIKDVADRDDEDAVLSLKTDDRLGVELHLRESTNHLDAELFVDQRLQDVIKRLDLISLDGELAEGRHENNGGFGVVFSDFVSKFHPGLPRHHNVEEKNIELAFVCFGHLDGGGKPLRGKLEVLLLGETG